MDQQPAPPSQKAVYDLLNELDPGSTLFTLQSIGGDHHNPAFLVEAISEHGTPYSLVIKQYLPHRTDPDYHLRKAQLEFKTLTMLQKHAVSVPEPLYLDADGTRLGSASIVMRYIAGESIWTASDWQPYVRELALTLAKIHSIPIDDAAKAFLWDSNEEAVWFRKHGVMPDYMQAHPEGASVWQAIEDLLQQRESVTPVLVHLDYWMGNVIWNQGRLAAVIDWEEAGYGDPAVDLGYCRMDMYLSTMGPQAADELLNIYEAEMGHPTANLALWEFAAAVRPIHQPDWGAEVKDALQAFIGQARERA